MNQMKIEDFENVPNEFLDTISETQLFNELESGKSEQKTAYNPNPAPEAKENNIFDNLNDTQPPPPGATNLNANEIISGELAAELLSKIMPVLLSLGIDRFMGIKAPKKSFEMNAAEKNTIAPIIDNCLAKMNISFENPFIALGLSLSFIYGSKIIEVSNNPDLVKTVKKSAEKVQNAVNPAGKGTRKPGETRGRKPKNVALNIG
jgi:hypothetical protein